MSDTFTVFFFCLNIIENQCHVLCRYCFCPICMTPNPPAESESSWADRLLETVVTQVVGSSNLFENIVHYIIRHIKWDPIVKARLYLSKANTGFILSAEQLWNYGRAIKLYVATMLLLLPSGNRLLKNNVRIGYCMFIHTKTFNMNEDIGAELTGIPQCAHSAWGWGRADAQCCPVTNDMKSIFVCKICISSAQERRVQDL